MIIKTKAKLNSGKCLSFSSSTRSQGKTKTTFIRKELDFNFFGVFIMIGFKANKTSYFGHNKVKFLSKG